MNDLTIIYYSSNAIPDYFMENTKKQLLVAAGDTPIISVSFKPMDLGVNICVGELERSSYMIYNQILIGARAATTEYVATAEDDVLYPKGYFDYRPAKDVFAYDMNKWSIYTWDVVPVLLYKNRRTMTHLIVTREALIKTLEERYAKYPNVGDVIGTRIHSLFGEPGRFENSLGITPVSNERYVSPVPSVVFSTEQAVGFSNLGKKKAHRGIRADAIEPWGTAQEIMNYYRPNQSV